MGQKLSTLLHKNVQVPQRTDLIYNGGERSNQELDEVGKTIISLCRWRCDCRCTRVMTCQVHLIAEYPRGAHFNGLKAPRANRFIVHSDTTNAELK